MSDDLNPWNDGQFPQKPIPLKAKLKNANGSATVEWQTFLQRDDGEPITNLANAAMTLRSAPELAGLVVYDLMAMMVLVTRSLPGSRMEKVIRPRSIEDTDVAAIQEWMQRHDMRRMPRDTVHQAIDLVAKEHAFHPIRDYLNGLRWDEEKRLGGWLNAYLGVDHTGGYAKNIGTMFLISMVARIFDPGCKVDYMLVLEDEKQGTLKSTACAILAGDWFSDSLPALHHGDAVRVSMHLRGKWLIEIAELSSFNKAEAGSLKAFLTQRKEQYTPKHARCEVVEERQCVFIGTTNKRAYLRDETGGRRFWPAKVGLVDIPGLKRDREQLFAEAVQLYRDKVQWWPDREFEAEHIRPQQDARFEEDAWEAPVIEFLSKKESNTDEKERNTNVMEIARQALFVDAGRVGTADQRRIVAILEREGWCRGAREASGTPWIKPKPVTLS